MVSGYPAPRCGLRPGHPVAAIAGYAPAAGALGGNAGHAGRSGRDTDIAPRPARVACGPVPTTDPHGGPLSAPTPGASVRPPALRARAMAAERRTWRDAGVDAAERSAATGTRGRLERALGASRRQTPAHRGRPQGSRSERPPRRRLRSLGSGDLRRHAGL